MFRLPLATCLLVSSQVVADQPVDFNRDVRPILADACFACHGFDAKTRKADLRLDVPEGAFAQRKSNPAIAPGNLEKSEVWARVTTTDAGEVMPPPHSKKALTAAQKNILKKWIEQGAKYQKHWAFEPVRRVEPPKVDGARSAVDAFLLARIKAAGLEPQPEADRETLIRRVAFALTGLPPTIKEVDEYLADNSPNAYEKMVDRYLASEHFGEEMARHWLDAARYGDTHGMHLDNERQMWAYRDWVVKAFNRNLPFDRFTVEQLAGDLLPEPTTDQLTATGFNRCNVTTGEGGSIAAEWEYRYAVERATVTSQVWLGLTAGCAVCHDHKYDPFTMKDFYSLYAFFRSAADPAMDGNTNNTMPFLKLTTPTAKSRAEDASKRERDARARLDALARKVTYTDPAMTKTPRHPVRDVLFDDVVPVGGSAKSTTRNAIEWDYAPKFEPASGVRSLRLAHSVGSSATIEYKLRPLIVPHDAVIEAAILANTIETPSAVSITFQTNSNRAVATWTRVDGQLARGAEKIAPGKWVKVSVKGSDIGLKPGDQIKSIVLDQRGGVVHFDAVAIAGNVDAGADSLESFAVWRTANGSTASPDMPGDVAALITRKGELKPDELDKIRHFYIATIARPINDEIAKARTEWETARTQRIAAEEQDPGTFIFRDRPQPVEAFIMMRGQYDKPGEKVEPAGPQVLPPVKGAKERARLNRLDLANWIVSPENPLTARVAANRFWQQFFGVGIVRTSYDFGTQGEPPSHPELLDWLASELVTQKWDVKRFVKTLVTSDAFRRGSRSTAAVTAADPANRLLARGPRLRLDAEQIRDAALATSGLLSPTMGGRGVKPYQPANIWEPIGYGDSNTRYYLQDHGDALYRRSLYVFIKRTAPPPFMTNFDAPNREQSCLVRERSNTPIQALQLLNDVQFFEAARGLAERVIADGGTGDTDKVAYLYRTVLARRPDADESRLIAEAVERQRAIFRKDTAAATKVVESGESKPKRTAPDAEIAAWTMVANMVLNLDEALNRN